MAGRGNILVERFAEGGNRRPLGNQKPIGGDAQRGVVVEAAPSTAFEMSKSDFLLELLIIALDAPAQLGEVDQISEGNVLRKRRKPVFGRLALAFRPLDQQPFLRAQLGAPFVAMRGANPQACKARAQRFGCALAPCNRAPGPFRQAERQRLDRDRSVLACRRAASVSAGGHGPTTASPATAARLAPIPWSSRESRPRRSSPVP